MTDQFRESIIKAIGVVGSLAINEDETSDFDTFTRGIFAGVSLAEKKEKIEEMDALTLSSILLGIYKLDDLAF